ncbi:MAG: MAPEG family protein [Hyphomonadaceae bacterium]|nr:MAPEG family protein [Hyphomonadaceae bacterium]
MTTELTMLAWSVALLILLVLVQALAGVRAMGLLPLANARDGLPAPTGFHARMLRVVDNHREGLTMFAPVVLVAAVADVHTAGTALGAQLFLGSRVTHAIVYMLGLPFIRPLIWAVGLTGIGLILHDVVIAGLHS